MSALSAPSKNRLSNPQSAAMASPSSASEETDTNAFSSAEDYAKHVDSEDKLEDVFARAIVGHNDIRFSSYRAAAKLRTLQRLTYMHHIDIWNVIEAFRENGLANVGPMERLSPARVRTLVASMYEGLQKRLPPPSPSAQANQGNQISQAQNVTIRSNFFANFLLNDILCKQKSNHSQQIQGPRCRAVKAVLATLCSGKLMDKLRYLFSLLSDSDGHLDFRQFHQYLRDIMRIPASVGEGESFSDSVAASEPIFDESPDEQPTNVNDFLETMMSDPGPRCFSWLLILHRIINSESNYHPVYCGSCRVNGFYGLRYKSERSSPSDYHLCQQCFWRGRIDYERNDDVFKEYYSFKSSSSSSAKSSIKKNLHCFGGGNETKASSTKSHQQYQQHHDHQQQPFDLTHIVPPIVVSGSRSTSRAESSLNGSLPYYDHPYTPRQPHHHQQQYSPTSPMTDEHGLIADYAKQIAAHPNADDYHHQHSNNRRLEQQKQPHSQQHPRNIKVNAKSSIIQDLERKNREIMANIKSLKEAHQMDQYQPQPPSGMRSLDGGGGRRSKSVDREGQRNRGQLGSGGQPKLMSELTHLRRYKDDLDSRLDDLQETRKELMYELEEMMKVLNSHAPPPVVPLHNGDYQGHPHHPGNGAGAHGYAAHPSEY